jgi:hypothetical protein
MPNWVIKPESVYAKYFAGLFTAGGSSGFERDLEKAKALWRDCSVEIAREFGNLDKQLFSERLLFAWTKIEQGRDEIEVFEARVMFAQVGLDCLLAQRRCPDLPIVFLCAQEVLLGNYVERVLENEERVLGIIRGLMSIPDAITDPRQKGRVIAHRCVEEIEDRFGEYPVYADVIFSLMRLKDAYPIKTVR